MRRHIAEKQLDIFKGLMDDELIVKNTDNIEEKIITINLTQETYKDFLNVEAYQIMLNNIGNCKKFSEFGLYLLLTYNIYGVTKYITNGDHVVLVIGKDDDAVVCDSQAGEIYPYSMIDENLKVYKVYIVKKGNIEKFYNVSLNYNPRYHIIKDEYSSEQDII